jgi:hypothetical protein
MNFIPSNKDAQVKFLTAPASKTISSTGTNTNSLSITDQSIELSDEDMFNVDSLALLLPNESYAFALTTDRPPASASRQLGVPEVTWRLQMGESGISIGERVFLPSFGAALGIMDGQMIRVQCIHSPRSVKVGDDFTVQLRISNTTQKAVSVKLTSREAAAPQSQPQSMQQQLSNSTPISFSRAVSGGGGVSALLTAIQSSLPISEDSTTHHASGNQTEKVRNLIQYNAGLCVTGLSSFFVSVLGPNESADISINVYALTGGLQELKSLYAVDLLTGREYPVGSLFKTFVHEDDGTTLTETRTANTEGLTAEQGM